MNRPRCTSLATLATFASLASLTSLSLLSSCGDDPIKNPRSLFVLDQANDGFTFDTYFDMPLPSDLRLTADGTPDFTGYPNRDSLPIVNDLLALARIRKGYPVMPIAYFHFDAGNVDLALPPRQITDIIDTGNNAPALLIDIDDASPERGSRYPLVAKTLEADGYVPTGVIAIAPHPGIVLRPSTRYAFVVRRDLAPGFERASEFEQLINGTGATTTRREAAAALYAPLWPVLTAAGISLDDVLEIGRAHV